MMKISLCFLVLVVMVGVGFGAAPVATVTSGGSFELHGTAVNTQGVPSWPVLAGDEIATSDSTAVIRFADGTRVTLGQKSRAKVEKTEDGYIFRLTAGAMDFTPVEGTKVVAYNAATPVAAAAGRSTMVNRGLKALAAPPRRTPPPPVSTR